MRVRLVLIDGTKKKCVQGKIAEDELLAIERLPIKVLQLGTIYSVLCISQFLAE